MVIFFLFFYEILQNALSRENFRDRSVIPLNSSRKETISFPASLLTVGHSQELNSIWGGHVWSSLVSCLVERTLI